MDVTFLSRLPSPTSRSMWRFVCCVLLSICSVAILLVAPASAHTLKTDGTISAVLHFQPDDDPVSEKPTEYILFLNDSTKRFSMAECNCTIAIKKDGKTISASPLRLNSQNIIGGTITFRQAGAYEVVFQGSPIKTDTFQPFTLSYLERVVPNPGVSHPSSAFTLGIGALVVSMIIIAFLIKVRYNTLGRS